MDILDTPYSNAPSYQKKCNKAATCSALVQKHQQKVRAMEIVTVSGSAGVALAHLPTGISLIGTEYSIRQFHILYQKIRIIEDNLEKRGHKDMPGKRLKDIVDGMLMGVAAYAAGSGVATGPEHEVAPLMDGLSTTSASILQSQLSVAGFAHVAGAAIHHAAHEVHTVAHNAKVAIRLAAHEVHVVAHDAKSAIHHIAEELSPIVHHPHDAEHGLAEGLRESAGIFHGGAVAPSTGGGLANQILAISIAHSGEHMLVAQFVAFAGERLARIGTGGKGEEVAEIKVNATKEKKLPLKEKKLKGDVNIVDSIDPPPCNCETREVY
ncbi:hypothetical protein FIBSPDRAFT_873080 [Athelia psychrophila]|uniref:Uncharacterized protein n=1 Tax=Athelia psychrophila TaxID=1759441 RepID=A0A165YV91_9AGAM|nr:hypothetical protein FIBSPDRAFT_873080 [Fibularhizoctonia sp. CBS 109695]